jgi:pyrroloquinoline quinone biosynthesis protein B
VRIVILRGGAPRRRGQPGNPTGGHDTADRGVIALGTADGHWLLINVSAAVAHQLDSEGGASAHPGLGQADLRAVVLTDAQIEHVGGLLSLRGGAKIDLYATPAVFEDLTTTLPVLPVLQHYCGVHWRVVPVAGDRRISTFRVDGMPMIEFTAIATDTAAPPHSAHHQQPVVGDSIALAVRDLASGQRVFCAPGLSQFSALEIDWMREADCLLVDGQPEGIGTTQPMESDWVELLCKLPARHKVMFADRTPQRRQALAARGIAMAFDGMEIEL